MLVFIITAVVAFLTGVFCREALAPAVAFLMAVGIAPFAIPFFHKLKFGQEIREEGPAWHQKKSGTPTMGGAIFIIAIIISAIIFLHDDFKSMMLLYLSVTFGVIGFVDDYIKVVKKRNLGLTEKQKLALQIIASVIFVYLLARAGVMPTKLILPFINYTLDLGVWYYPLAVLVIISAVNAVNLTDGLDGLASSVTVIVMLCFMSMLKKIGNAPAAEFAGISAAALTGFLWFNKYPAKIFMGDTGSLFLGALVVSMAFLIDNILLVLVYGFIFVMEALSDVLQVLYYKATRGKRLFKMAPFHHHLEKCGFNEVTIVAIFTLVNAIFCFLAYFGMGNL